ncbi:MAG: MiaB/RimO family radical SAM methylthiotransferase [Chlorobiaceae bacterium]|nr:MiaB/RimO family radical SAM methylthiotransferase [Chlorobiaceae bacterium]
MKQKSVAAVTLGCKVNYAETSAILDALVSEGWLLGQSEDVADLVIVHTCAVTGQAEKKTRQQIRKIIRKNPACRVAVIGCYAQLDPLRLAEIDGVSLILGTTDKFDCSHYSYEPCGEQAFPLVMVSSVKDLNVAIPANSLLSQPEQGRTRAFLKIQDGCSYGCAYCTIPLARGRSRSVPVETLIESANNIAEAGYREIVLTGINIADYRDGDIRFSDLLKRLDKVDVSRIRIGSVEPDLLDDELVETVAASNKIMPHFHLPLQGGTDRILRAMGRHYDTGRYRERLMKAVSSISGCGIGADVMIGYPGESDSDFEEMYSFIEDLPAAYLHVFTCSVRPGTQLYRQVADRTLARVHPDMAASRYDRLVALGSRIERRFAESFIGSTLRVLFEEGPHVEEGVLRWSGYSGNYLRVGIEADLKLGEMRGSEHDVFIEGIGDGLQLHGRLLF